MKLMITIFCAMTLVLSSAIFARVIDTDDGMNSLNNALGNSTQTVAGVIQTNSNLSTFNQMLLASGLSQDLEGAGPFTVFAPTDAAFHALPKEAFDKLLKKENIKLLQAFLKNHIVPGNLTTQSMTVGNIHTLGNQPINIYIRGSLVTVNGFSIAQADLTASNGVVQIMDHVFGAMH